MNASLVIIGTEITRGLVQDTHTKNITFLLSELGVETSSIFTIPDSHNVSKYISTASLESDIIITTGGLGPTNDDMTRFELSDALSLKLIKNKDACNHIKKMTGALEKSNSSQSLIPEGFKLIQNDNGTALGFYGEKDKKLYISLPGPPFELNPMLKDVKKIIASFAKVKSESVFTYTLFATTEAHFNDLTNDILEENNWSDKDIIVGTCYKEFRVLVYLYTDKKSISDLFVSHLRTILEKEDANIKRLYDGDIDLFELFASTLIKNKLTICTAESITGGLIAKKFTDIAGSSKWFDSSIVSYSDNVKISKLGVDENVIKKHSAVSMECAYQMALGAQKMFGSDVALSITGFAGPDGAEVGKCFMGVKFKDNEPVVFEHKVVRNTRIGTRNACCVLILLHALAIIQKL